MDQSFVILCLIILLAYTTGVMAGFGSSVIAVTLGALLFPLDLMVPVIMPMTIAVNGWVVWRHRRDVDTDLLLRSILPLMGLGVLLGLLLRPWVTGQWLKLVLGVMVMGFSLREVLRLARGGHAARPMGPWEARAWRVVAGVFQLLYVSGGPALVYSLTRRQVPKAAFRATLCCVWLIMNCLLTVLFSLDHRLTGQTLLLTLKLAPLLPLGIWLGGRLHSMISESRFQLAANALLLLAGAALIHRSLTVML